MKPTGQLQRTPVDVSLQVQSHPPLFTAQVSEITAHRENVHELPAFFGGKMQHYPSTSAPRSLLKHHTSGTISQQNDFRYNITSSSSDSGRIRLVEHLLQHRLLFLMLYGNLRLKYLVTRLTQNHTTAKNDRHQKRLTGRFPPNIRKTRNVPHCHKCIFFRVEPGARRQAHSHFTVWLKV